MYWPIDPGRGHTAASACSGLQKFGTIWAWYYHLNSRESLRACVFVCMFFQATHRSQEARPNWSVTHVRGSPKSRCGRSVSYVSSSYWAVWFQRGVVRLRRTTRVHQHGWSPKDEEGCSTYGSQWQHWNHQGLPAWRTSPVQRRLVLRKHAATAKKFKL